MKEELEEFLQSIGYQLIPSNLPEFKLYFHIENNGVNILNVVEDREGLYLTNELFENIKLKASNLFTEKGYTNNHILSLIISEDIEKVKQISQQDAFCWMLQPNTRRLIIYENQVADFYGMKNILEGWLSKDTPLKKIREKVSYSYLKDKAYITISITFINTIIFLICTFTGEILYNIGELNAIAVIQNREYYRILTSIFLHADANHLFSNMIIFFFLGETVERSMGHLKYLCMYLIAGIGGGLASMGYGIYTGSIVNSIGASGAIFGMTGALLWLVIVHRGKLAHITLGKVLFLIVYSLYSGFTATNVDNAAHIGGLLTGLLFTVLFLGKHSDRSRRKHED
ncbi:MAG: rhomboid family intramembrane serine protease [Lachnospiraceae bacterium]